jgi:hypothetical protein
METLVYTVGELPAASRVAAEQLVGHPLSESQRIRIEVSPPAPGSVDPAVDNLPPLPEWFNVYEGLTDAEIDAITTTILSNRFDLGRPIVE